MQNCWIGAESSAALAVLLPLLALVGAGVGLGSIYVPIDLFTKLVVAVKPW